MKHMIQIAKKWLKLGLLPSKKEDDFEVKMNDLMKRMRYIQKSIEDDCSRRNQEGFKFFEHTHLG